MMCGARFSAPAITPPDFDERSVESCLPPGELSLRPPFDPRGIPVESAAAPNPRHRRRDAKHQRRLRRDADQPARHRAAQPTRTKQSCPSFDSSRFGFLLYPRRERLCPDPREPRVFGLR